MHAVQNDWQPLSESERVFMTTYCPDKNHFQDIYAAAENWGVDRGGTYGPFSTESGFYKPFRCRLGSIVGRTSSWRFSIR